MRGVGRSGLLGLRCWIGFEASAMEVGFEAAKALAHLALNRRDGVTRPLSDFFLRTAVVKGES